MSRPDPSWQRTEFERWFDVHPFLPDGERVLIVGRHPGHRTVRSLRRGSEGTSYVVFASFRDGRFKAFSVRPTEEFFRRWVPTERSLPGWAEIAHEAERVKDRPLSSQARRGILPGVPATPRADPSLRSG